MIQGDVIDIIQKPPVKHTSFNLLNTQEESLVISELKTLLLKRIIKPSIHEIDEFVSPIFITHKSDGGIRIILNLKELNKAIQFRHFKMHTLKDVLQLVSKNCFMASIDLKDAYHSIKISENYQKYLKFECFGQLYQYTCFPNGLGPCPRKFTKLTVCPMSKIRQAGYPICGYIDDFFLTGNEKQSCFNAVLYSANIFEQLGFVVHPSKSQFEPLQQITFLGIVIDSVTMTITLSESRTKSLKFLLKQILKIKKPTIRLLAKVIGHIISAMPTSKFGALQLSKIRKRQDNALNKNNWNFDAHLSISGEGKDED